MFVHNPLVGPEVPVGTGAADGSTEGLVEGDRDGRTEGRADGLLEGDRDGTVDGRAVATRDGMSEGDRDGRTDGLEDGLVDGREDATNDGLLEGDRDGTLEGEFNPRRQHAPKICSVVAVVGRALQDDVDSKRPLQHPQPSC